MRKYEIFMGACLAASLFMIGCTDKDDGGNNDDSGMSSTEFCTKKLERSIDLEKLAKDKPDTFEAAKKTYIDKCVEAIDTMPVCKKEAIAYETCILNTPTSYFDEQNRLEEE